MTHFIIRPDEPHFKPMFTLLLHESLVTGLTDERAILPGRPQILDGERLRHWANERCANPTGQKAALARAIAELTDVCPIELAEAPPAGVGGTFWDAVTQ